MSQPRIAADYTERKSYQKSYVQTHRAEINANKRKWRKARKLAQKNLDAIRTGKFLMEKQ